MVFLIIHQGNKHLAFFKDTHISANNSIAIMDFLGKYYNHKLSF